MRDMTNSKIEGRHINKMNIETRDIIRYLFGVAYIVMIDHLLQYFQKNKTTNAKLIKNFRLNC